MSDRMVSSVSTVDTGSGGARAYEVRGQPVERAAAENEQAAPVQAAKTQAAQSQAVQQERQAEKEQAAQKPAVSMANASEVYLKFRVDEKSKNITVYVIDRASKRVLRSIPPEELNKMQSGDLLELLA